MFKPTFAASGVVAVILGTVCTAAAEEPPEGGTPPPTTYTSDTDEWSLANKGVVPAPSNAFELTLGSGYTQGFGNLEQDVSVGDTAQAGVGFELGLGHRVSPHWGWGLIGGYQMFDPGDELANDEWPYGITGRLEATYHISPYSRLDPWVKLGSGYRYLCECEQPAIDDAHMHGIELANLNLGFDMRLGKQFGLAPLIGGGMTMFLWEGTETIDEPELSSFVFAGLQARFDMGGSYQRPFTEVAGF